MGKLFENTVETYNKYVLPTYRPGGFFTRGQGCRLYDDDNREYLDFASGISVCNLGHCHPAVTAAVAEQAATLVHVSNLYYNPVTPLLAEAIISKGFDGNVFFANSGAEANEGLIKLARKFGSATGRSRIVAMNDSFHGRTLATLAATGRSKYRKGFAPDMPGFDFADFNDFESVKAAVTPETCAILLEPVQGEGGILPADSEFLKAVRELCNEKDLLLLFDEVQCGMGRTGYLYAWQGFGVEPDAFSMAKAIANGLPMGAFVVRKKYCNVLCAGEHASTFGGTPLVSAAALAVFRTIEKENVLENCRCQGEFIMSELRRITADKPWVKEIRGRGLMIGIVLDRSAAGLQKCAVERGLVTLTAGETVWRWLPPLTITRKDAEEAIETAKLALDDFEKTF